MIVIDFDLIIIIHKNKIKHKKGFIQEEDKQKTASQSKEK